MKLAGLHQRLRARPHRTFPRLGGLQVLEVPVGTDIPRLAAEYQASGSVEWAEPDFFVRATTAPNDPDFVSGLQWHLRNTGQNGGLAGADIQAVEAWDRITGASNVVVAVIDSGLRLTHEDLAANLWVNPGETSGNGVDDDGNGFVDDVHGINAAAGTGDARDVAGHGTHVAGLVGAVGDNGLGGTGVAWRVRLMACRFLDSQGRGSISDAVTCLEYAREMGARIMVASWVTTESSTALETAVAVARQAGILFVAAAGNDGADNDRVAYYPPNLDLDNVVSVAATTPLDELLVTGRVRSNYGARTVDLAAPGLNIHSTYYIVDNAYVAMTGSSQAAPQVAGAAALVMAAFPAAEYREVIDRLLLGTDPLPALQGRCRTGGRLNVARALEPGAWLVGPRAMYPIRLVHGRPFSSGQYTFRVANWSAAAGNWSVSTAADWLTVAPAGGALPVGGQAEITMSFNDKTAALSPGRYEDRLEFALPAGAVAVPVVLEIYPPTWLTLTRAVAPAQGWQVGLRGEPNAVYVIQHGSTVVDWFPASTNTLPASGELPAAYLAPDTAARRFFRAVRAGP